MIVNFNANKAFGFLNMNPELKQRFELVISSFSEQVLSGMDYSNLESITVTDNFVDDVLSFQREHLQGVESVTDNEFGRAFGKMIYVPNQGKYYIFLDAEFGSFLMDDEIMDVIISQIKEDKSLSDSFILQRKRAMNILVHELQHYIFANVQTPPDVDVSLDSKCRKLMFDLFDEYHASRKAIQYSLVSAFDYDEENILEIEKHIMANRLKYNLKEITINQFAKLFHQYTSQALMCIAANIGSKHGVESNNSVYENCRCHSLMQELEQEFDCLFTLVQQGKTISISNRLIEWLKEYYGVFKVYIHETIQGMYYVIPFDEGDVNK